jgi:hypothetical protein
MWKIQVIESWFRNFGELRTVEYHRETPENISRVRSIPSYQTTLMVVHTVEGSWLRAKRDSCLFPFLGFGPGLPASLPPRLGLTLRLMDNVF